MRTMTRGSIQYMADTRLIEKIFLIDAGLRKEAGAGEFLRGMASSVMGWAKRNIEQKGVAGFLADLLVPGILFKVHPVLGTLASLADVLGFSTSKIISSIVGSIKPKLDSGEPVSLDDVNSVGKDAVAAEAGPLSAEASSDPFDVLRQMERRGELVRFIREASIIIEAKPSRTVSDIAKELAGLQPSGGSVPKIPFIPDMGSPLLQRVFGNLLQKRETGKAKWLIGGFFIWFVKTSLLGAGLVAGASLFKGLLQKKNPDAPASEPSGGESYTEPAAQSTPVAAPVSHKLTPNGSNGQDIHANDHASSTWMVPIKGGSVRATLMLWAGYVYKELQGREDIIGQAQSFNKTVQEMMQYADASSDQLTVPAKFKSIKQVVDQFASEVASKI